MMKNIYRIFKIDFDTNRIYGLDILRAFAVLAIVIVHGISILPANTVRRINYFLIDGVSVFFVLSGFLIGGILIRTLEKQPASFKTLLNFWLRRWLRTLPLYYVILILLILLSWFFIDGFSLRETKLFFIFCQNLYKSDLSFFSVSWSLSIEEWFYLVIPVVIFTSVRIAGVKPKFAVVSTAVIIILYTIFFRYYRYVTIDITSVETFDIMFRRTVITRLDSLMFGVTGACLFYYHRKFWIKHRNVFFIAGLLLHVVIKMCANLFFVDSVFYFCNVSFLLDGLATLLLLPFLSQLNNGSGVLYKIMTCISLISYSIYLVHAQIVQDWVIRKISLPYLNDITSVLIKYFLYWGTTFFISVLSYKYIELPFLKLRNKKNKKQQVIEATVQEVKW